MLKSSESDLFQRFQRFLLKTHAKGSNAAASYLTALRKLNDALLDAGVFLRSDESVWDVQDIDRLTELYSMVKAEQKKSDGGIFKKETAKSYWRKGFCSAAVKDFAKFVSLTRYQEQMLNAFDLAPNVITLADTLRSIKLPTSSLWLDNDDIVASSEEGKTAIREVEVRLNQNVFREMVLLNYRSQCCLTGLPITEVLRASHISAWADDEVNRMNPENGLCLSATYDAAFDRHLISFDEDYRLIFAPSLKEYYTNEAFQEQFGRWEGHMIKMPKKFLPSKVLMEKHRAKLVC